MSDHENGWEIPIHLSLTAEPLTFGLKRDFAVLLWCGTFLFAFHFWMVHFLPIAIVIHSLVAYLTKHDPQFVECLVRSLKYKSFYE